MAVKLVCRLNQRTRRLVHASQSRYRGVGWAPRLALLSDQHSLLRASEREHERKGGASSSGNGLAGQPPESARLLTLRRSTPFHYRSASIRQPQATPRKLRARKFLI